MFGCTSIHVYRIAKLIDTIYADLVPTWPNDDCNICMA